MKKVYMIMVDEWTDGIVSTSIEGIHATLDGAKSHFQEITWNETVNFVLDDIGVHDTSDLVLKQYGIKKRTVEHVDGTLSFSIEYESKSALDHKLYMVCVHIYKKDLLD